MKPTAKYVDECLDIVQLQHAQAVMTPLTEQKSLNLHGETTACDQVQHSLFRAVVGKLQYITGVRPDLMFATKNACHTNLRHQHLQILTRAKKVLRYLKRTRELNLYLTIPALKPSDLNMTLKHITGYSDADWAGDPVTRKSTSCTLCYVDQFLLTSEFRRVQNREQPELLAGSPPSDDFNSLLNTCVESQEISKLKTQIRTCVQAEKLQMAMQKHFVHERPKDSASWDMPEVQSLVGDPRVHSIDGPMCRWSLKATHQRRRRRKE